MEFERIEKFEGCPEWYAYRKPTPYKIVRYEWPGRFGGGYRFAHLEVGKPFYCAYYGWWLRTDKAQFGNNVNQEMSRFQTLGQAKDACQAHYLRN